MWFWGFLLGMFAGAAMFGWGGAFAGAMIGLFAGLVVSKPHKSPGIATNSIEIERRLASMQKGLEEIRGRLDRLERGEAAPQALAGSNQPLQKNESPPEVSITSAPPPLVPEPPIAARIATDATLNVIEPDGTPPRRAIDEISMSPPTLPDPSPSLPTPAGVETPSPPPLAATDTPLPKSGHTPDGPGFVERMLEGNIVAKLGVVILFFGVGFLLKFAYDHGLFPPGLRLFVVAAASAVMFLIGRRVLEAKRTYALVMMGGAMGLLYLDVFFALKTFGLISAPLGFFLFAALGVATLFLAVKLDARVFAALGLTGAFLAPILAATGSGNHVVLFSYYLLLNFIILGASWFKSWRELNFIGFLFTFAIAIFWGHSTYRPEHFATVEPFLVAFFLLYLAIPILFAQRQPPELKGIVDATLVFGVPMSAAMLQAALTRGMDDNVLAWSAAGGALIYAGLARVLWPRETMRLLAEAHFALAIVFGTVAPYFAFRGYPTFAFWTLEGAAIFWMGCRQKSGLARAFAILLQVGAAGYFWWVTQGIAYPHPWWNDRVVGCILIAAAAFITAWFMHRFAEDISKIESSIESAAIAWGGVWLLLGIALGAWQEWPDHTMRLSALLLVVAVIFTVFEWLGTWLAWPKLRLIARAQVVLIGVALLLWMKQIPRAHPLQAWGVIAWPVTFAAYFFVLHRQRIDGIEKPQGWRYMSAWGLMILLATWEALWRYDRQQFVWVFAIGAVGLMAAALRFRLRGSSELAGAEKSSPLTHLPMWWALIWWFAGIHGVVDQQSAPAHRIAWHLAAMALSIAFFELAGKRLAWPAMRRTQILLTAAMMFAALHLVWHGIKPFHEMQFFAWVVAFAAGAWVLYRQECDQISLASGAQWVTLFALGLWLVGIDAVWRADDAGLSLSWQTALAGFTAAAGLALATRGIARQAWPFSSHASAFRTWSILPLLIFALLWTLFANSICNGIATPLRYLPILNPLDLAEVALLASGVWALNQKPPTAMLNDDAVRPLKLMFAVAAFFWVNAALLRTVHHWVGVPFELQALLHSLVAQAALSLLWTATALVLMLAAGRTKTRPLWMAGAALLGLVVLKLFVNDIGNSGTERVVSFIGVGVLLMVIGYVAPVPPSNAGQSPR